MDGHITCIPPLPLSGDSLRGPSEDARLLRRQQEFDVAAESCQNALDLASRQTDALELGFAKMQSLLTTLEAYLRSIEGKKEAKFFAPLRLF